MKNEPKTIKDVIVSARMGTITSAIFFIFAITWGAFEYVSGINESTKSNTKKIEKIEDFMRSDAYTKNFSNKDFLIRDERIHRNSEDIKDLSDFLEKLNDKIDEIILQSK